MLNDILQFIPKGIPDSTDEWVDAIGRRVVAFIRLQFAGNPVLQQVANSLQQWLDVQQRIQDPLSEELRSFLDPRQFEAPEF